METGRRGRRVRDEGRQRPHQEAEEQGRPGKPREGPEVSRGSEQVRAPASVSILGHEDTSEPQEVPAAPSLVQDLGMAGPSESSRTEGTGALSLSLFGKTERDLHQSLSLPEGAESG